MNPETIPRRIPPIKKIWWIPDEDEHDFARSTVSCITLGAFAPSRLPGSTQSDETAPQSNEWILYLPMTSSQAIRIEAVPCGYEVKTAVLVFSREFDLMDPDVIKTVHISFECRPKVASLVQLIRENGYDKYKFMSNGRGRRWWMFSFLELLHKHAFFDHENEFQEAIQALKTVWHSQDIPVQSIHQTSLESGAGTFFDKTGSSSSLTVNGYGAKHD